MSVGFLRRLCGGSVRKNLVASLASVTGALTQDIDSCAFLRQAH